MPQDMTVRAARPDDCPAILELWRQASATPSITDTLPDIQCAVREQAGLVLLAIIEGKVVGTVVGGWDGWRGNIYRLAVLPAHRRRGIARALVEEVVELLRARGAKRITALVEHEHADATAFWDSLASDAWHLDPRLVRYARTA